MVKTFQITKENNCCHILTDMQGQEMFEAYVAFTGYLLAHLKNPEEIHDLSMAAVENALRLMEEKQTLMKENPGMFAQ